MAQEKVIRETNIWKATLMLGLATMLTRATNFITQIVIAQRFGASLEADAYFLVENVMLIIGSFVLTGFSVAYIPIRMDYLINRGDKTANRFHDAFISFSTIATILLAVISALIALIIISPGTQLIHVTINSIAGTLLLIISPSIAFLGLTAGCIGILQVNRRFVIPEISNTAYNLIILAAMAAFSNRFGIFALAWGAVLGSLARLLIQIPASRKLSSFHLTRHINHEGVRQVQKRVLPIFVAYAGTQVTLLIGNLLASGFSEGAVSGLVYASRIMLLPVGLLILPFQTTIFPTLSQQVAKKQLEAMGKTVLQGLRLLTLITVPLCAGIIFLRAPLIVLFYQRGAFDMAAAGATANILGWLSLALPATAGFMLINSVYSSLGEPVMLVKINLFHWTSTILLGLLLSRKFGPDGVAMSISLSTSVAYGIGLVSLKKGLPAVQLRELADIFVKALISATVMVIILMGLEALLKSNSINGTALKSVGIFAVIMLNTFAGALTFGFAAVVLRIDEVRNIRQIFKTEI